MLYFMPKDNRHITPVPYTAPCIGEVTSQWFLPEHEKYGHFRYWATVTLNGVRIFQYSVLNEDKAKARLKEVMDKITNLAREDIQGVVDLEIY